MAPEWRLAQLSWRKVAEGGLFYCDGSCKGQLYRLFWLDAAQLLTKVNSTFWYIAVVLTRPPPFSSAERARSILMGTYYEKKVVPPPSYCKSFNHSLLQYLFKMRVYIFF